MVPTLYQYKVSGLDNVYLKGGVTQYLCPKCGAASTVIKNIVGLHKVIAINIAVAKRRLKGAELRFLREQLGFSAEELATLVEYSEDHIRKIESGVSTPKGPYEMFLRVAVMRGMKAPDYDLHDLVGVKEYKIEELRFENKDRDWDVAA
jgi:DNA-binding transcriptional regulator YiaG